MLRDVIFGIAVNSAAFTLMIDQLVDLSISQKHFDFQYLEHLLAAASPVGGFAAFFSF